MCVFDSVTRLVPGSPALTRICKWPWIPEPVVANVLGLPNPEFRFDFVISVAVVHHLSTRERRSGRDKGNSGCFEGLSYRGWPGRGTPAPKHSSMCGALEQRTSRRGWDKGDDQDVMVPWVLKEGQKEKMAGEKKASAGLRSRGRGI